MKTNKSLPQIKKENAEFARAIKFMIEKILVEKGKQKVKGKPLVTHSLDTAYKLRDLGYKNDLVIAGVLHDLIEDADVLVGEIEKEFGNSIARLVEANSFKQEIEDETTRYQELFKRTKETGKDALILKAADILVNLDFFYFVLETKLKKSLIKKWEYFLEIAQPIQKEPVYQELKQKITDIKK